MKKIIITLTLLFGLVSGIFAKTYKTFENFDCFYTVENDNLGKIEYFVPADKNSCDWKEYFINRMEDNNQIPYTVYDNESLDKEVAALTKKFGYSDGDSNGYEYLNVYDADTGKFHTFIFIK